jgi:glycolate oxidase iron-sulfur subunit
MHLGVETESPRGRIAYMKAVHEGRIGITERVVSHWESCLQCRACEAVCPSGVPYGRIMEQTRFQVLSQDKQGEALKRISAMFLTRILPRPNLLRFSGHIIRLYQRCGLQKIIRFTRILKLFPGNLESFETQLPVMGSNFFGPSRHVYKSLGPTKRVVGLLSGCVMPLMHGDTMSATVRVLVRNGCDVVVPVGQTCCGALNLHSGDLELGRKLARANIDVFANANVDVIVTSSAGCGSSMKEYAELLENDLEYAERARWFSDITKDVTEFLVELPWDPPKSTLIRKITYQDPCHLAHAQRITHAPRELLTGIKGIDLVEMKQSTMCCGSAGFYSLVQPELSAGILETKINHIRDTNTEQVVTANPGCMMQIENGLRSFGKTKPVVHVVDILDEAYGLEMVE